MATTRGQARDAVLTAASSLFTSRGIRAVSADRIMAEAGVSKVTFYRHFPSKDDLVVAYLEAELLRLKSLVGRAGVDSAQVSKVFEQQMCQPGFRGCPFMNAAAEYPDPDHPVREVVARFRAWMMGEFAQWASKQGAADPDEAAATIMMLRDGALVEGFVSGEPARAAAAMRRGIEAVVRR